MNHLYQPQMNKSIISCNTKEANPFRNISWVFQNSSNSTWIPIPFNQTFVSHVRCYHVNIHNTYVELEMGKNFIFRPGPARWSYFQARPGPARNKNFYFMPVSARENLLN